MLKGYIFRIKKILDESYEKNRVLSERAHTNTFLDLVQKIFEIFFRLRQQYVSINGTMLKSIGLKIAQKLNIVEYTASNGWLANF